MTLPDMAVRRLYHQQLSHQDFHNPTEVVGWLGAVQAQDYPGAKWALGLRLPGMTDAAIEQAFTDGAILRTHVMRPTWHFVTPADIRWMLALTAPRVKAASAYYSRQLELDDGLFVRSNAIIARALEGGQQLTRTELSAVLQGAGIAMDDLRFVHILMRAELDAVICSGARRGKQFTYALLEERAPQAKPLSRDEALAELTQRYFTSHGPATIQDFVWWSGLTMADARTGLDAVQSALVRETIDSRTYWQSASTPDSYEQRSSPTAYLLPAYDEYLVSYKDRSASVDAEHSKASDRRNSILNPTIVIEGQVVGMWQRTLKKRDVTITSDLFTALDADQTRVFAEAVQRYAGFLDARIVEG